MPLLLVATVRLLARARVRQLEGVAQHAVGAEAREHRLLDHDLALGALVHHAAEVGVFALGVLAHHEVVDVAGLAAGQRTRHAVEQPHRPQVDVLVELAAELEQRAPQRDVVGHRGRPADGAEVDRVDAFELLLPVVRHHLAVLRVPVAAGPLDLADLELEAEAFGGCLQHAQALGQHFLADAVAGDGGDAERGGHVDSLLQATSAGRARSSSSSQPRRSSGTARASSS